MSPRGSSGTIASNRVGKSGVFPATIKSVWTHLTPKLDPVNLSSNHLRQIPLFRLLIFMLLLQNS